MNFLTEAANMKEFAQRNKEVAFVGVPKLYDEYTNHAVLVMEQIDISNLLSQYGTMDLGEIDVAEVMMSLMEVMKENKIIMPHGLTMLARGLTHMEGGSLILRQRSIWWKLHPDILQGNFWKRKTGREN